MLLAVVWKRLSTCQRGYIDKRKTAFPDVPAPFDAV
jgi:hypothetical protein